MTGSHRLKTAAGESKLRVQETETRDAIVTDTQPCRTIAYVSIGAESWGQLLAAAPDLLEALQMVVFSADCGDPEEIHDYESIVTVSRKKINAARAAIAKAGASPHEVRS